VDWIPPHVRYPRCARPRSPTGQSRRRTRDHDSYPLFGVADSVGSKSISFDEPLRDCSPVTWKDPRLATEHTHSRNQNE
jgi:hypothetical protein